MHELRIGERADKILHIGDRVEVQGRGAGTIASLEDAVGTSGYSRPEPYQMRREVNVVLDSDTSPHRLPVRVWEHELTPL